MSSSAGRTQTQTQTQLATVDAAQRFSLYRHAVCQRGVRMPTLIEFDSTSALATPIATITYIISTEPTPSSTVLIEHLTTQTFSVSERRTYENLNGAIDEVFRDWSNDYARLQHTFGTALSPLPDLGSAAVSDEDNNNNLLIDSGGYTIHGGDERFARHTQRLLVWRCSIAKRVCYAQLDQHHRRTDATMCVDDALIGVTINPIVSNIVECLFSSDREPPYLHLILLADYDRKRAKLIIQDGFVRDQKHEPWHLRRRRLLDFIDHDRTDHDYIRVDRGVEARNESELITNLDCMRLVDTPIRRIRSLGGAFGRDDVTRRILFGD